MRKRVRGRQVGGFEQGPRVTNGQTVVRAPERLQCRCLSLLEQPAADGDIDLSSSRISNRTPTPAAATAAVEIRPN